jgi:hypothetical protein
MPVHPDVPEPLKSALQAMEDSVQSTKSSLAYCAPEMMDRFWIQLQQELANTMSELYKEL